jgi:MFS family permease
MIAFHNRIRTQQDRVPFSWMLLINMTWFTTMLAMFVISVGLPFSLRRFTDDTRLIGFVTTIGSIMGIVIGPLCNYLSDRLWSRWGRRRPFLIVSKIGTLLALVLIPYMPSLAPLVLLVVVSSLMGDVGSTFEPLWLEIIPPDQRGRGFVMRNWMIQLAVFIFFQILFAQWWGVHDLSEYGLPAWSITGEQLTYAVGAVLIVFNLVLLTWLIKEVKPVGVNLKPLRELDLNPIRFVKSYFVDVFGDRRWWPIFLLYVAPSFAGFAGASFQNLMLVEQFGFNNGDIAQTGLPPMVVGMTLGTLFWGWQADRFKVFSRWSLIVVSGLAGWVSWLLVQWSCLGTPLPRWLPAGVREILRNAGLGGPAPLGLPDLSIMFVLAITIPIACAAFGLLLMQELNRRDAKQNPRLWPWLLQGFLGLAGLLLTIAYLTWGASDHRPTIAVWYALGLLTSSLACLGPMAGPLFYELLPADKIGTISSGCGLLSTALGALGGNVAGFWIYYYTEWWLGGGSKDYASVMILSAITSLIAVALMMRFFFKLRNGELIEYGRLKLNSDGSPIRTEKTTRIEAPVAGRH